MKIKFRKDINALRALAVIGVLFYHSKLNLFGGGYLGVDIFFVISGYLISYKLLSELESRKFSFSHFYLQRVRRIIPALYILIIFSIFIFIFIFTPEESENYKKSILYTIFFSSNLFFWKTIDYFSAEIDTNLLAHTWSLGIEEQFYFLLPVGLFLFYRFSFFKKNKITVVSLFAFLSFSSMIYAYTLFEPQTVFYLLPTRIWEFFIGTVVAILHKEFNINKNTYLSVISITLIIISYILFDGESKHPGYMTLLPTLATGLFILLNDHNFSFNRILGNKYLQKIGLASYSIYLYHFPIFAIDRYINLKNYFNISQALIELVLVSISLILGYISYKLVETPTRNIEKFSDGLLIKILIILFIGLLFISNTSFLNSVVNKPFKEFEVSYSQVNRELVDKCLITNNSQIDIDFCLSSYDISKSNYLLIGDSVAHNIFYSLEPLIDTKQSLSLLAVTGCIPLFTQYENKSLKIKENCINNYSRINKEINERNFEKIFISYDYSNLNSLTNESNLFMSSSETFFSTLKQFNNIEFVLIGQPVIWNEDPVRFINKKIKFGERIEPVYLENTNKDIFDSENNIKTQASSNGIKYVSLINYLCEESACQMLAVEDKKIDLYFRDKIHLSIEGIQVISEYLFSKLFSS